jgi:hypothetical protein
MLLAGKFPLLYCQASRGPKMPWKKKGSFPNFTPRVDMRTPGNISVNWDQFPVAKKVESPITSKADKMDKDSMVICPEAMLFISFLIEIATNWNEILML